jgi:hypothetical protein
MMEIIKKVLIQCILGLGVFLLCSLIYVVIEDTIQSKRLQKDNPNKIIVHENDGKMLLDTSGRFANTNIVIIDSCEYFLNSNGHGSKFFTHKGNCKFCDGRLTKKLDSLIKVNNTQLSKK